MTAPFALRGRVVKGDQLGRTLGFPTANISIDHAVPQADGIYAARCRLDDGRRRDGVAYIGRRPTVQGAEDRVEVFLFDFHEDIYGRVLEAELVAFVRGDQRLEGLEPLKRQIQRDCAAARAFFDSQRVAS